MRRAALVIDMKNGSVILLAAAVLVLIALAVYKAGHNADVSDDAESARSARAPHATGASSSGRMHAGAIGSMGSSSADERGDTSNRPQRGSERTSGGFGAPARPRVPEAVTGGEGSLRDPEAVAEQRGTIEDNELAANPSIKGHDLPASQGFAAQAAAASAGAAAENDTMPELRPNVVYQGGDRVFDTSDRQQITDRRAITGEAGSISFWTQPQWEAGNADRASFVQIGENGLRIVKDGDNLRFEYTNSHGDNELGGVADISGWQAGEWRYIAGTWQGGSLVLYVDGQRMKLTTPTEPPPVQSDPRLYVGSVAGNGNPSAPAQMTGLEVSNAPMTLAQIAAAVKKGPPVH